MGSEHIQIDSDGYRDCCGDAHPSVLGEDCSVTWASAWPTIGGSFERALAGETMYLRGQRMFLKRFNGALKKLASSAYLLCIANFEDSNTHGW